MGVRRGRLVGRSLGAAVLLVAAALSGCSAVDPTVVAVLAADAESQLQQPLDADGLRERLEQRCDGCQVEVFDAAGDQQTQDDQLDQAVEASADIVVLDPVEPEAAEELVARSEVPVLAYGTLVPGADWFVGVATPPSPTTGVDTDLEAAREVISGDRDSFTHLPATEMSDQAADVAVGELAGQPVGKSTDHEGVPSWLFEPVEVTVNDLTSVVVATGAMSLDDLCSGQTLERCTRFGLV